MSFLEIAIFTPLSWGNASLPLCLYGGVGDRNVLGACIADIFQVSYIIG